MLVFFAGCADASLKGMRSAAIIFAVLCVTAIGINIALEHVMPAIQSAHPAVMHDWAAMFYLNPFHISPQPVISSIQKTAGIPAGLVLYMLAIATVSSAVIKLFSSVPER